MNINNEIAKFKRELSKLSKNELVRGYAALYAEVVRLHILLNKEREKSEQDKSNDKQD